MDEEVFDFKKNEHSSPGLHSIGEHVRCCLQWLNKRYFIKYYNDFSELAIDYGKNGTPRFFPLSAFVSALTKDGRFDGFIKRDAK